MKASEAQINTEVARPGVSLRLRIEDQGRMSRRCFGRSQRLALGSESCGEGGRGEQLEQRDGRICSAEQLRDPVGWEVDTADSVKARR